MNKKNYLKHFVLVGPSGKQSGRKDQHNIALQLAAIELTQKGNGGGIISGLLPRTSKNIKILNTLIAKGYEARAVKKRFTFRSEVRDATKSDSLIAQLAVLYQQERGKNKRAMAAPMRDFSAWVCSQLLDPGQNTIKRLVGEAHPELPNMVKPDWWKKQLNQRVKK